MLSDDQQQAVLITCAYTFGYSLLVTVLVCAAIAWLDRKVNR